MTNLTFEATATFIDNDDTEISKVGYITKASEGLANRVIYLGSITIEGKEQHCYTTAQPIVKYDTWYAANDAIERLNNKQEYNKAGFGIACIFR